MSLRDLYKTYYEKKVDSIIKCGSEGHQSSGAQAYSVSDVLACEATLRRMLPFQGDWGNLAEEVKCAKQDLCSRTECIPQNGHEVDQSLENIVAQVACSERRVEFSETPSRNRFSHGVDQEENEGDIMNKLAGELGKGLCEETDCGQAQLGLRENHIPRVSPSSVKLRSPLRSDPSSHAVSRGLLNPRANGSLLAPETEHTPHQDNLNESTSQASPESPIPATNLMSKFSDASEMLRRQANTMSGRAQVDVSEQSPQGTLNQDSRLAEACDKGGGSQLDWFRRSGSRSPASPMECDNVLETPFHGDDYRERSLRIHGLPQASPMQIATPLNGHQTHVLNSGSRVLLPSATGLGGSGSGWPNILGAHGNLATSSKKAKSPLNGAASGGFSSDGDGDAMVLALSGIGSSNHNTGAVHGFPRDVEFTPTEANPAAAALGIKCLDSTEGAALFSASKTPWATGMAGYSRKSPSSDCSPVGALRFDSGGTPRHNCSPMPLGKRLNSANIDSQATEVAWGQDTQENVLLFGSPGLDSPLGFAFTSNAPQPSNIAASSPSSEGALCRLLPGTPDFSRPRVLSTTPDGGPASQAPTQNSAWYQSHGSGSERPMIDSPLLF